MIPLVVEEAGEDTVGGTTTAHAFLFITLETRARRRRAIAARRMCADGMLADLVS